MSEPRQPKSPTLALIAVLGWLGTVGVGIWMLLSLMSSKTPGEWKLYALVWVVLSAITSGWLNSLTERPSSQRFVFLFIGSLVLLLAFAFIGCCIAVSKI